MSLRMYKTTTKCKDCGEYLVYEVDLDARSESEVYCDTCPTPWDKLVSKVDKLENRIMELERALANVRVHGAPLLGGHH